MPKEPQSNLRGKSEDAPSASGLTRKDQKPAPAAGGVVFDPHRNEDDYSIPNFGKIIESDDEGDPASETLKILLSQQKVTKCRELLEQAQDLISQGKWREALDAAAEALEAEPRSGEALALRGRCLAENGQYRVGHRSLSGSLRFIEDSDLRAIVLRWDARCIQAYTKRILHEVAQLLQSNDLGHAQKLIDEGLQIQPSNLLLLYHLAHLKWQQGDGAAAENIVARARAQTGGKSSDLVSELEREFCFREHGEHVERARQALRRKDMAEAARILEGYYSVLGGIEHYDGLIEYTRTNRETNSILRPGQDTPTPQSTLRQQTLRWILDEEIKKAKQELETGAWRKAIDQLNKANDIAADCGLVHLLLASARILPYINDKGQKTTTPADSASIHQEIEYHLRCALVDTSLEEQVKQLRGRAQVLIKEK